MGEGGHHKLTKEWLTCFILIMKPEFFLKMVWYYSYRYLSLEKKVVAVPESNYRIIAAHHWGVMVDLVD